MAMMMTGRVLLVCVLCVLWCGAVFGHAEGLAAVGGSSGGDNSPGSEGGSRGGPEVNSSLEPLSVVGGPKGNMMSSLETSLSVGSIPPNSLSEEGDGLQSLGDTLNSEDEVSSDVSGPSVQTKTPGQSDSPIVKAPEKSDPKIKTHISDKQGEAGSTEDNEDATESEKRHSEVVKRDISSALQSPPTPPVPAYPAEETPLAPANLRNSVEEKRNTPPSQTKTDPEAPEPSLEDAEAEKHGEGTTKSDSMKDAAKGRSGDSTPSSISTSDSVDAQRKAEEEDDNEMEALNPNEASILPLVNKNGQGNVIPSFSAEQQEQKGQPLGKSGAGGVPASPLSTVTSSSAGKESVKHLTPGTSPDGHQNVDGGSTADGYQTVSTGYGDKTQEDGPHKTPTGNLAKADANGPTTMGVGQDGTAVNTEVGASSAEDEETVAGKNVQEEEVQPQNMDVNGAALNSSLGHLSQGNNSDAGTVRGSGLLPLLLLGLWGFAAL
ncbi:Mucin-associated surface protein (MASP) [Trypanosoma cruzi]|uniref:Mucin-associated surface protein (MASP), putative n=1 Tax=Trypanosoma cruzi (strain CL Brener) TaxID=353153 RepID=Q4DJL5_TRYCC|nr:mucin-associated surface protein (MASP), putative [Trypanosoma cruzi]EAN92709.1 mucin-associated surface protein (MASP), putative [Trypanosoma cruzi]KAF8284666.1 Mucin-associated surface protein (MASP) [Trypanosoma cruzi]|eukprot:XP_814560.1 mucin-associated surface protein (MASP) [Trypanosoma cruzi strain CL Brener]